LEDGILSNKEHIEIKSANAFDEVPLKGRTVKNKRDEISNLEKNQIYR
jgi:hypothetical protein